MKIASCSFTRSWPTKSSSRLGRSERSSSSSGASGGGILDPLDPGRADAGHRAALSAPCDQLLGGLAAGLVEQPVGLLRREAEPEQALARERARVVGRRAADDDVVGGPPGDLLAQLDDDPLRRALADAGHGLEAGGVARGDRVQQLARRPAGQHRERDLRAHALDADQHQEQLALGLGREAVQVHAVVAQDQVREQRRLLARAAARAESVSEETLRR